MLTPEWQAKCWDAYRTHIAVSPNPRRVNDFMVGTVITNATRAVFIRTSYQQVSPRGVVWEMLRMTDLDDPVWRMIDAERELDVLGYRPHGRLVQPQWLFMICPQDIDLLLT